ncbi:antifreeze protein [Mycena maculata]|uniref:Antifreeze protein n=1 Tax=Mycena maculata TaxID=230809 RepID=A0AAD7KI73_9AGAR|nr:antifreeze protein [Mycena maculata]
MISTISIVSLLVALGNVVALGPAAVNLGTAGNFAILSKSGVSTVPPSVITGNVAVSPIAAIGLTGFSLTLASNGESATSSQVTGELFAASYATPTPATLTAAIGDMGTAFTDATGRASPNFSNLANGTIGGLTLAPGLYKWTGAVSILSNVVISGASTDSETFVFACLTLLTGSPWTAWIFQVAGTLSIAAGKQVTLSGGALASNIVWVVSGAVTASAGSVLEGVILGKTSISLLTGATANGRLLSQTSIALQKATVNN